MVFIASLTDHCCNLIVKTKYRAIKNHIAGLKVQGQSNKSYSATSDSEDVSENEIEYDFDEISEQEEHMIRHMSYGDVGWNAFGKMGLYTVNIFIAMTQFGFCVSYFIFIGNTVYSLFPVTYCDNSLSRSNSSSDNIYPFCRDVTLQSINHHDRVNQTVLYPKVTAQLLEKKFDNFEYDSNYTTPSSFNISTTENSSLTTPFTSTITTHSTVTTTNSSKDTTIFISTTTATNISEISSIVQQSTAPSLKLLVAAPLPIMILFAMIRTIRNLSFISLTASISIFTGCIAVFTYIIIGEFVNYVVINLTVLMKITGLHYKNNSTMYFVTKVIAVFCLHLFHLLARKLNLETISIYSNMSFHNFHFSESSFSCPGLWASGLA